MKRVNDFTVGLTILGGIVLVVGAVLWTKEARVGRTERHVSARFRDVGSVTSSSVRIEMMQATRISKADV